MRIFSWSTPSRFWRTSSTSCACTTATSSSTSASLWSDLTSEQLFFPGLHFNKLFLNFFLLFQLDLLLGFASISLFFIFFLLECFLFIGFGSLRLSFLLLFLNEGVLFAHLWFDRSLFQDDFHGKDINAISLANYRVASVCLLAA